jgi:hypothetical protein
VASALDAPPGKIAARGFLAERGMNLPERRFAAGGIFPGRRSTAALRVNSRLFATPVALP